jgi:hypothetical protein
VREILITHADDRGRTLSLEVALWAQFAAAAIVHSALHQAGTELTPEVLQARADSGADMSRFLRELLPHSVEWPPGRFGASTRRRRAWSRTAARPREYGSANHVAVVRVARAARVHSGSHVASPRSDSESNLANPRRSSAFRSRRTRPMWISVSHAIM